MKRVIVFLLILLMAGGGFMLWWKQKTNGMIYPESSEESAVLKAFETMQQAMFRPKSNSSVRSKTVL